jgi:polysaccharide export outer membrane protein
MNIEKLLMLRKYVKYLMRCFMAIVMGLSLQTAMAEEGNYLLGSGDVLKINVYNNPDLSLETRVTEGGMITFPLVGEVQVGGITSSVAEKKLAGLLSKQNDFSVGRR